MSVRRVVSLAGAVLLTASAGCSGDAPPATSDRVRIVMSESRFVPDRVVVRAGAVTFEVVNQDPIPHEIIVGDEDVQAQHERGTDDHHDGLPGQASLGPGETDLFTMRFDRPGTLIMGCHRPGHYAYGMRGTVEVVA